MKSIVENKIVGGVALQLVHLIGDNGSVSLVNLGATVLSINMPDKNGIQKNVCATLSSLGEYFNNSNYIGSTVGRVANRIAGGIFQLGETTIQLPINNGGHHLHGGVNGFHTKLWNTAATFHDHERAGVRFEYMSADGEEGYPGNLNAIAIYELDTGNRLHISFQGTADALTVFNPTFHGYFNLSGFDEPTILNHQLQVAADEYLEKSELNVPNGNLLPVKNTGFDFTHTEKISNRIGELKVDDGYDHSFVLRDYPRLSLAAVLHHDVSGRQLKVFTDQPCLHIYSSNFWDGGVTGDGNIPFVKYGALALETQFFPDSVNHSNFPSILLYPGKQFNSTTVFEFSIKS